MEANFPKIFSEIPFLRDGAFAVIKECLEHPSGVDVSSTLYALGRSYDENGGDHVHLESAKKLIEIMKMISVICNGYPDFFSNVEIVKILLGIISQHGASEFGEAVECMFHRFSQSFLMTRVNPQGRATDHICLATELFLNSCSDLTLKMFFPDENEKLLTAGKALCLKALVGTFIWICGSLRVKERAWTCVRVAFEAGYVEAIHASLAKMLIDNDVRFILVGIVQLGAMFKAIVPILNKAMDECNGRLFTALCRLLTTIMSNPTVIEYLRSLSVVDPSYVMFARIELRSILEKYFSDPNPDQEFAHSMEMVRLAVEATTPMPPS
jgi:hypothetical protein